MYESMDHKYDDSPYRESSTDSPVTSRYTTASDILSSRLERPGTTLHRVFEKVGNFTGLIGNNTGQSSHLDINENNVPIDRKPTEMTKKILQSFKKIYYNNKDNITYQETIINGFKKWTKTIDDEYNGILLEELSNMMMIERKCLGLINARLEDLMKSLSIVHDKEKHLVKLKRSIEQQNHSLAKATNNYGDMSSNAAIEREKLEAIDWNHKVYNLQYNRSIKNGFKDSTYDYLLTLQSMGVALENESKKIYELLRNYELDINLHESPKKILKEMNLNGNPMQLHPSQLEPIQPHPIQLDPPLQSELPLRINLGRQKGDRHREVKEIVRDRDHDGDQATERNKPTKMVYCSECGGQQHHKYASDYYENPQATIIEPDLNLGDYKANESWC